VPKLWEMFKSFFTKVTGLATKFALLIYDVITSPIDTAKNIGARVSEFFEGDDTDPNAGFLESRANKAKQDLAALTARARAGNTSAATPAISPGGAVPSMQAPAPVALPEAQSASMDETASNTARIADGVQALLKQNENQKLATFG